MDILHLLGIASLFNWFSGQLVIYSSSLAHACIVGSLNVPLLVIYNFNLAHACLGALNLSSLLV